MRNESSSFHPSSLIRHPCKDGARVDQLLEQLLESGGTPEEVCRACPELLASVRAGWQELRVLEAEVSALFPESPAVDSANPNDTRPNGQPTPDLPHLRGYEMQELLGRGGMGVVYKAWHLRLHRPVAVKMLLARRLRPAGGTGAGLARGGDRCGSAPRHPLAGP